MPILTRSKHAHVFVVSPNEKPQPVMVGPDNKILHDFSRKPSIDLVFIIPYLTNSAFTSSLLDRTLRYSVIDELWQLLNAFPEFENFSVVIIRLKAFNAVNIQTCHCPVQSSLDYLSEYRGIYTPFSTHLNILQSRSAPTISFSPFPRENHQIPTRSKSAPEPVEYIEIEPVEFIDFDKKVPNVPKDLLKKLRWKREPEIQIDLKNLPKRLRWKHVTMGDTRKRRTRSTFRSNKSNTVPNNSNNNADTVSNNSNNKLNNASEVPPDNRFNPNMVPYVPINNLNNSPQVPSDSNANNEAQVPPQIPMRLPIPYMGVISRAVRKDEFWDKFCSFLDKEENEY